MVKLPLFEHGEYPHLQLDILSFKVLPSLAAHERSRRCRRYIEVNDASHVWHTHRVFTQKRGMYQEHGRLLQQL